MKMPRTLFFLAAPALMLCLLRGACAAPLALDNVTAQDAAAQIGARYDVEITFDGHVDHYAAFSVDDSAANSGCLEAVNALANAVGADFNKTYVLSSATGEPIAPQVDTTAAVPDTQTKYAAGAAIAMVAGLDDATVQGADDVTGTVTLSSPSLTVAQAAREIAAQTQTRWRTVYVLTPRTRGRVLSGTVVGRTEGGSPIIEFASVYYHDAKWQARQQRIADDARRQAQAEQQAIAQQQAQQEQQALAVAQAAGQAAQQAALNTLSGNGASQNGDTPYGNSYNTGGGYDNGNGLVINGGSGYGGYSYGNAPVYFGNGNY